ncbi:glycosyltransferase family 4 protein [Halorubrum ezzemoulense]|uniref:glycosyltransferase family 4 protein n=1 Tax=Halorubrum ezzemoulense TaxID=337243 RepID=UPI0015C592AC|nr:glycosyltransferase family 4 protein [Halorubrum ezzemoulense]
MYFCQRAEESRHWDPELGDYGDWDEFLPNIQFGPLFVNPSVYRKIIDAQHDAILIGDNGATIPTTIAAYAAAQRIDAPVGIWTEGIDTDYYHEQAGSTRPIVERFRRTMYARADVCLGYSRAAGDWLRNRGVPDHRIITGRQVVPASILPEAPPTQSTSNETTICSLGYLERRKGLIPLLNTFKQIDRTDIELCIAGDGPLRPTVKKHARDDDRITFHGHVSEEKKASLLAGADLFVFPTFHDPWGLVVNEALHYGTPVMVTRMAASSELVQDTGAGWVLPEATVPVIRAALKRIIDNPKLLKTFAQHARRAECVSDVSVGTLGFNLTFQQLLGP